MFHLPPHHGEHDRRPLFIPRTGRFASETRREPPGAAGPGEQHGHRRHRLRRRALDDHEVHGAGIEIGKRVRTRARHRQA